MPTYSPADTTQTVEIASHQNTMIKDHISHPLKKHLHLYVLDDVLINNAEYDRVKGEDWTVMDYLIRGWSTSATLNTEILEEFTESVNNPEVSVVILSNRWVWAYESTRQQLSYLGISYDWLVLSPDDQSDKDVFFNKTVTNLERGGHVIDKFVRGIK